MHRVLVELGTWFPWLPPVLATAGAALASVGTAIADSPAPDTALVAIAAGCGSFLGQRRNRQDLQNLVREEMRVFRLEVLELLARDRVVSVSASQPAIAAAEK